MSVIAEIHKDLEHGVIRMIAEYRDRLMAEALRLCHDESTAEDLVSSTFSKAIRNFDSYKVDDNFFGWLKTIMVNAYRSDLRNPVTRGTTPTDPDVLATDESLVTNETEDRILKDSDHDALREAVGRLPPIYRRAVVLHYFEEFSIKDVAIALHAPVGTIFRRLNVARKLLAKDLAVKLGKKKPLVILLALLFGAGALFGAWQAGVSIVEAMSEGGEAVSMNPPTIEDNQPTLTTADPDEPVMTYPTFSSTTATTEKEVNKQEESIMTTIKKTLLAAVSAVSLMSAGSADAYQDLKTYLMPSGATATDTDNGFKYAYTANDTTYYVEVFAKTGSTTWTVPDGVAAIDYLVVGGGGAGGSVSTTNLGGSGGGGAGGMLASSEPIAVAAGSEISILVGAGGEGVAKASGKSGEKSELTIPTLSPITALGGGYGGKHQAAGGSGGSGGGGGAYRLSTSGRGAGGKGDSAQGCDGGDGGGTYGGCGGGAGKKGGCGTAGAVGRSCAITGKDVIFAGGGGCGGNAARNLNSWGSGGSGIGGDGGSTTAGAERGAAGMDGTGSGGGGNGAYCTDAGGKGGDGIVIIRYLAPSKDNVTVAYAGEVAYGATLLNPTYGDYAIGDYATYTAPTFAETETAGVRAYCLGWQLLDKYDLPSGELNPSTTATPEYTDGGYTVQWNWELRYTVAATPTGSGSVSGAGDYVEGTTVTLVATADEGSHFAGWEGAPAGATTIEETTLVFTMGTAQVNITAKFDEDLAKGVTILAEGGNYGTPSPAYGTYAGYADGTERTYSMAETVIGEGSEKIYLAGWKLLTGTGELVRDSSELHDGESISLVKFTCGTSEAFTLVWRWETRYTLTATANPAEGGTVTGAGDYAAESEVTLTANVTGGYKLTGWEGAPDDAMEDGLTLTFAMPAEATTVTANFEMVPWGITVVSGVTTNDYREKCEPGTPYKFLSPRYAEIKEGDSRKRCLGYTLTPMREGGEESELIEAVPEGENLAATVTYAEPVRLTWKWADDYYFTLAQDGEGTVTGPAEDWYASGTEFTLTATPAKNYEFLCWMGSVSGTDTTITGTITAKTSVKALFSPVQQVKSDWEAIEGKPAMMRTVKSLGKTYCVVKFTDSTTFDIPKKVTSIDCLVVGGGGGGAGTRGGGGGAGGFVYQTGLAVTPGETLKVTVGGGGAGGTQYGSTGGKGGDSTLFGGQTITAQGGGYGARDNNNPGAGASGGGVGGNNQASSYPEKTGGASTAVDPEQGNPGGDRTVTTKQKCAAGGGGAGGKGGDVDDGKGGDGLPSAITGETVWYAVGGPGGTSSYATDKYADAAANTGNGGTGGKAEGKVTDAGYAGGSGVVIIRYALPSQGAMILIF